MKWVQAFGFVVDAGIAWSQVKSFFRLRREDDLAGAPELVTRARRASAAPVQLEARELGLDELLGRVPAGLLQFVGETGWQLSHGERSRLYIARALLQGAGLVILDESFGALDPDNFERCLQCVLRRANALIVIAHP